MHLRYGFRGDPEHHAFAQLYNIDASYKDLSEVCRNIRGKSVKDALSLLERAYRKEIPIEYRRHNKKLGHRHELGGKKGRYPVKAIWYVRKVLVNALNNAKVKRLDEESLFVVHAAANKQTIYPRLSPKGRRMRWDYETARVEIVLRGNPIPIAEMSLPEKKKDKEEKKEEAESKEKAKKGEGTKVKREMKKEDKGKRKVKKETATKEEKPKKRATKGESRSKKAGPTKGKKTKKE